MDYDPLLGDYLQAIEELVDMGYIDPEKPGYGIAKKIAHDGVDSLSLKQKQVYEKYLAPVFDKVCQVCGNQISVVDLPMAYETDVMLCGYHRAQGENTD